MNRSVREKLKELTDKIVIEHDVQQQFEILKELLGEVVPYALQDYTSCRDIIQVTIGQLERVSKVSIPFFFQAISDLIETVLVEKGRPAFVDYIVTDWDSDIVVLLDKVAPFVGGEQRTFDLHPEVADSLNLEERRFVASFLTHAIQSQGVKTQWSEDVVLNSMFFCNILYPICKKDGMMELLYHSYNNILDRLNSTGHSQQARDLVEGLFIIGYNEGLEAESYFSACRAYTGANNVIAGLLFYYISLYVVNKKGGKIHERFAYDLYWQYLKICRSFSIFPKHDIAMVVERFKGLDTTGYDKMSFYHTLFYLRLVAGEGIDRLVNDVTEFLDQNREDFFRDLNHGAMPWIALIVSMQEVLPNGDYSGLTPYIAAARSAAQKEGNELFFDILEEKNLANRLKELLYKLQDTRNRSDYSMDNQLSMIVAKKLISQAYDTGNISDFLLAMSPKTDYSIVLPTKDAEGLYRRLEIQDVAGDELSTVFSSPKLVGCMMATEDKDMVCWIGRGKTVFLEMTMCGEQFEMAGEISVTRNELKTIENSIAKLKYERDIKIPGQPVYVKSVEELENEGKELANLLKNFSIEIPESVKRLLFIKDLEISSYPHNMFIDSNTKSFVSVSWPCCNTLSTEVLFKTNTLDNLCNGFKKALWIPYGGEELTFDMIHSKLEGVIKDHNLEVQNELSIEKPLSGDVIFLCAHGGCDISTTEVFYVNDKPILDTLPCIGVGKVAILFICFSGTISRSLYDNAMHTLVKQLILKGYRSVVAPMWSLCTDVITPWLSTFLVEMENGEFIIDAVYKANMELKKSFVAPSAWACLHLFGNPYTCIADNPRIVIE